MHWTLFGVLNTVLLYKINPFHKKIYTEYIEYNNIVFVYWNDLYKLCFFMFFSLAN